MKEAKKVDYENQWKISDEESEGSDAESIDKPKPHKNKSLKKRQSSGEDDNLSSNTDYEYDDY